MPSGVSQGIADAQVRKPRWLGPITTNVPAKPSSIVENAIAAVSPE
jgi:hypothetical protein